MNMYSHNGEVMPMYCAASGKVVLAFLPEQEWHTIKTAFTAYHRFLGRENLKSSLNKNRPDGSSLA
jgi:DNA-binding IclR family transcriptional regulator